MNADLDPVMIFVRGLPVAQPRAQVNTVTRRAYTPDKSGRLESWKTAVMGAVLGLSRREHRRLRLWASERIALQIVVQVRLKRARTSRLVHPTGKPDWDNLLKAIQDALEDARAIRNDSCIVMGSVLKRWTREQEAAGATILLAPYREDT